MYVYIYASWHSRQSWGLIPRTTCERPYCQQTTTTLHRNERTIQLTWAWFDLPLIVLQWHLILRGWKLPI